MSLFSLDVITPAFEKTKQFLLPIHFKTWLKLAFLLLFTFEASPSFDMVRPFNDTSRLQEIGAGVDPYAALTTLWTTYSTYIIIGGLIFIFFILILALLRCLFTFTFLRCVDEQKVLIRRYTRETFPLGMSYFWASLLLAFFSSAIISGLGFLFLRSWGQEGVISFSALAPIITVAIIFTFIWGIIMLFIDYFVVYTMYVTKKKFFASLASAYQLFKKEYKDMLLFVLLRIIFGILSMIFFMLVFLIILLILILIGVVIFVLLKITGIYSPSLFASPFFIFTLMAILILICVSIILFLSVPIEVFLRTYTLSFMNKLWDKNRKIQKH